MKKTFAWLTVLAVSTLWTVAAGQRVTDTTWSDEVRTVQLYRLDEPLEAPLLTLGGGEAMRLEFDVLRAEAMRLSWHLGHCDAHWRRDDLSAADFISGWAEGPVESYEPSFMTLTDYVHYSVTLGDGYSTLTASGNYAVTVTDDETGDTLLTRRFRVSEQSATAAATVGRPYNGVGVSQRQEVDVTVASSQWPLAGLLRPEYVMVEVQQNGRNDNRRWLEFSGYDGQALAYRHRECNIFEGGNTYRFFDMSNLRATIYNIAAVEELGGEVTAFVRPCEDRSRSHYLAEKVLCGGMKVNVWDRERAQTEAEYVWVYISLPMAQPMLDAVVHVSGALTDWRMDETTQMDYDMGRRVYYKRLLLKQGYYAYQLLTAGHGSATARLEGDHYETPNRYTVYVYYRHPADRADRLLAVSRVGGGN